MRQVESEFKAPPLGAKHRAAILERDGHKCCRCKKRATEVDHILPRRFAGGNEEFNLQSLCKRCHAEKTSWDVGDVQARMYNTDARRQRASDYEAHNEGECEWPCQFCERTYEADMQRESEEEFYNPLDHDSDESWHYLPIVLAYAAWSSRGDEWRRRMATWLWRAYGPVTGGLETEVVAALVRWACHEAPFPKPIGGQRGQTARDMLTQWLDSSTHEVWPEHLEKLGEARAWYAPTAPSRTPKRQGRLPLTE